MKDNLPNYLNPHNIDPGRVEPAHIDAPPGFDSIRPICQGILDSCKGD